MKRSFFLELEGKLTSLREMGFIDDASVLWLDSNAKPIKSPDRFAFYTYLQDRVRIDEHFILLSPFEWSHYHKELEEAPYDACLQGLVLFRAKYARMSIHIREGHYFFFACRER